MALARWLWSCGIDTVELATVVTMVVFTVFACGIAWIALFEVMLSAVTEPIQMVQEKDIGPSISLIFWHYFFIKFSSLMRVPGRMMGLAWRIGTIVGVCERCCTWPKIIPCRPPGRRRSNPANFQQMYVRFKFHFCMKKNYHAILAFQKITSFLQVLIKFKFTKATSTFSPAHTSHMRKENSTDRLLRKNANS